MKYEQERFSVAVGSKEYRDGWDRIFGKCNMRIECGGSCHLLKGHSGECECEGDEPGKPGTCPA